MGKLLKQHDLVPEAIITSSAERALTTAELAALSSGYEKEIIVTRTFYHAEPEDYIAYLQELPDDLERVMVVGHNPGMEELVQELTGQYVAMPTAALAQIELPLQQWQQLDMGTHGHLVNLWRPKEL
jgi:phosphohistidine phosphatase